MDIRLRIWRLSLSAPTSSPCSSPNEYCTRRKKREREVDSVVAYILATSRPCAGCIKCNYRSMLRADIDPPASPILSVFFMQSKAAAWADWWKVLTCLARLKEPQVLSCGGISGGTLNLLGLCLPFYLNTQWLQLQNARRGLTVT